MKFSANISRVMIGWVEGWIGRLVSWFGKIMKKGRKKSVERRLGALRSCILSFPLLPHRCRRSVQARNVACFDFA